MYAGFFKGHVVHQMGISVWDASVGLSHVASALRYHGIIADVTREQGVKKINKKR